MQHEAVSLPQRMKRDFNAAAFRVRVYRKARIVARPHLPWRRRYNGYRVLVAEVMLQQTQAGRVSDHYPSFLKRFPSLKALARSSPREVLAAWQGLGYNRRALRLREAAHLIERVHHGRVPRKYESLRALPGVGEYTARAVRVFAWNEPEILLETNVRSVFLHECFPERSGVSDRMLIPYLTETLDAKHPRRWYEALMDYGTSLKRERANPSRRSDTYRPAQPFAGSARYARGRILALALAQTTFSAAEALRSAPRATAETVRGALTALIKEKTVRRVGRARYALRRN